MRALLLAIWALPLAAQIQLLSLAGDAPAPVGASVNLGTAAVRDSVEFRFRALNNGAGPAPLQTLTVGGAAFSLAAPFVPVTLGAGQSYDFAVRFAPAGEGSYSAVLTVNAFTTLLRAAAVPGPSLVVINGGQATELPAPSLQVNVALGQSVTLELAARNPYATPLVLNEIAIAGTGFALVSPPAAPATIAPGEMLALPVRFTATAEGDAAGALTVGPRRLSIFAVVFRPVLAAPAIVRPAEGVPRNGQQMRIRLQLAEPALGPGTGVLRATFTGDVADPAIVFPNGQREIPFAVAAGSREATFDGAPETVLQTGTTAGVLRLDAVTEAGTTTETFRFERGPLVVDTATARRTGNTLEIDVLGFDNTRTAGSVNFRFFDRAGAALGGVMTADVGEAFRAHFAQSALGGVFRFRAAFPVTGDATIVGSVLIEMANAVGRTDLQRLTFP
jgi:hypothetical protein